jgi:hypothetical protein
MVEPPPSPKTEGATQVFKQDQGGIPASAPPLPAGPSAFTQIISGPAGRPPVFPGITPLPAQVPAVVPPAAPQVTPPVLAIPQPPVLAPLPVPRVTPPKLNVPPPEALPRKVSWMPVIIGLNVLFIATVILILIFALKR